jgi:hypothetical protein
MAHTPPFTNQTPKCERRFRAKRKSRRVSGLTTAETSLVTTRAGLSACKTYSRDESPRTRNADLLAMFRRQRKEPHPFGWG